MKKCTEKWMHVFVCAGCAAAMIFAGCSGQKPLSDRFVEDASFVRLKTLTLNYAFPKKICNRLGINTLSCFATGYNLFTWTNYTGQDPEVNIPTKPTALAEDTATTPVSIRFSFGINLNF